MIFGWENRALVGFDHDGEELAHYYFLLRFGIGVTTRSCIEFVLAFRVGSVINITGID